MSNPLYYVQHKILRRPIRMRVTYDNKVNPSDHTIIFLHGIAASSNTWKATIKQLKSENELKNYRIITVDLLGFGKSIHEPWLDYNYHDYRTALTATIRKLNPKSPITLVGHSMGCLIAVNYALNSTIPLSSLILVSPPVILPEDIAGISDKFYRKTYFSIDKIVTQPPISTIIPLIDRFSSFDSKSLNYSSFLASMHNIILNPRNFQDFIRLHLPTTIIHGRFDPLLSKDSLNKINKNNPLVKFITVSSGHDISILKRAKIIETIKEL